MTDGAHLGIGAEAAMEKIVGGKEIEEEAVMTDEEFEAYVRGIDYSDPNSLGYDAGATAIARMVLEAYETYPQLQKLGASAETLCDQDGKAVWTEEQHLIYVGGDLYEIIKLIHGHDSIEVKVMRQSTGFMWGWAVNAARSILGLDPVANPAILTFD